MKPAQEDHLLQLATRLAGELEKAPICLVGEPKGAPVAIGVPASCIGHAVAFLHCERDLGRFREFVEKIDALDDMTAPNQQNPRAQHLALQAILRQWLKNDEHLDDEGWLYVLSWVRRLLPKRSKMLTREEKQQLAAEEPKPEIRSEPARGDQMAVAFARFRAKQKQ